MIDGLKKALPLANDYREIRLPKKGGGLRKICIPSEELKEVQRKLILPFLKKLTEKDRLLRINDSLSVSWYLPRKYNCSYVEHARLHSDSRFIFHFDLKDAFNSVSSEEVRRILFWLSVSDKELVDSVSRLTTFKGCLPQGAPTSPLLFYLSLMRNGLFEKISSLALPEWKLSFYVDNFVLSGEKPLPDDLRESVFRQLIEAGFGINRAKTWLADCRQGAPLITGIRVEGTKRISLSKKTIRRWRGFIHRAAFLDDPKAEIQIKGFVSSLRPIYGQELPPQLASAIAFFEERKTEA